MIFESRGKCFGSLSCDCGAELDPDGIYRIDAELAISSGASHLGKFPRCPLAIAHDFDPLIDAIIQEFRIVKRFGMRQDKTIPFDLLLVIDSEVGKLEECERRRAEKLAQTRSQVRSRGTKKF